MPDRTAANQAARMAEEAYRGVFTAWASGTEAALKATFDAQNAALTAGLSLMDVTGTTSRDVTQQWIDVARKAQEAALAAFRENVRAAEKLADEASRATRAAP